MIHLSNLKRLSFTGQPFLQVFKITKVEYYSSM